MFKKRVCFDSGRFLKLSNAFFCLGLFKGQASSLTTFKLEFVFHIYGHTEGVTGVLISNEVYPTRNAHVLLGKIVDEFLQQNGNAKTASGPVAFPALKDYILKYQKADDVDQIAKITRELEDTKIVLHKTIESVSLRFPIPILRLHCGHCL